MSNLEFGGTGTILKATGSITTGVNSPFVTILALEASDITVESNWVGAASPEPLTLVEGQVVYGKFTEITWVLGKVVAYR